MKLDVATLIVPFYRNVEMLREQCRLWNLLPEAFRIIVVDDGSPEPAAPVVLRHTWERTRKRLQLYRIGVDIPWNRGGARNLGAQQCATDWLIHVDIDHVLLPESAGALLKADVDAGHWYRFRRFRNGKADATRMKDAIPRDQPFGEVKPHVDSYLVEKAVFWKAGGYNEDFSGCLGGGTPFLAELEKTLGAPKILPDDVSLQVYTRDTCADASDHTLSRDTSEFTRRKQAMRGNYRGSNPLRFPWERIL